MRFLVRRVFDVEVAYDVHAETFAIAFEKRVKFRGSTPEQEQAWLYAIARSQLSAYWRQGQVQAKTMSRLSLERPDLNDDAIADFELHAELDSLKVTLETALARLPTEQSEAVKLRIVQELPYEEIAARQGAKVELVRARVSRGLRHLEKFLDVDDEGVKHIA